MNFAGRPQQPMPMGRSQVPPMPMGRPQVPAAGNAVAAQAAQKMAAAAAPASASQSFNSVRDSVNQGGTMNGVRGLLSIKPKGKYKKGGKIDLKQCSVTTAKASGGSVCW